MVTSGGNSSEQVPVLVEMRLPRSGGASMAMDRASSSNLPGFQVDSSYEPVTLEPTQEQSMAMGLSSDEEIVVVRGTVSRDNIRQLESSSNVIKVWSDAPIEPFAGNCPIPPCDCDSGTPKGDINRAAQVMGASQIWASGYQGQGIVIGIVDGGISAQGRVANGRIPNVIGGWPNDWGTRAEWSEHGNMTSTDALGMAPQAQIYDIRVSGGTQSTISNALQGFQWAINQYRSNGTPQILSNSWGMYQPNWAPDYVTDPNHPFTRKVVEAVNAGIVVLFAAGNCGATCPDGRCGGWAGPSRDIWGANGHPLVITVGAVNSFHQLIGYSSSGPAALDPKKPDVCGASHFTGYFNSDSGTSAACPVVAGVVALLKQANSSAQPAEIKTALQETAWQIGGLRGWNQYSGYGVVQGNQALSALETAKVTVYADAYYYGASQALAVGNYDIGSLTIGNDAISSIKVPPGMSVKLYEHAGFRGRSITLTNDCPWLGSYFFNDVVSSLIVSKFEKKVVIYSNANYTGPSQELAVGNYDTNTLAIGNDALSSIKVPQGMYATLYEDPGFSGQGISVTSDIPYFGWYWDNRISSIQVAMLG